MALCSTLIASDIQKSCSDPLVKGFKRQGLILNREDIDYSNSTWGSDVISVIDLFTSKKAYNIEMDMNNPFNGTNTEMVAADVANTFTHTVAFTVLNSDPDVCDDIIDKLASGEFVIILQAEFNNANKTGTPGDSVFRVYGWSKGLRASAINNDPYSADTGGGWHVELQEVEAPVSGYFFYNTDYATTVAAYEALKTAAV